MIVYAVNIHTGGGKVLLDKILTGDVYGPIDYLFHDFRYQPPLNSKLKKTFSFKNNLLARLKAEWELKKFSRSLSQQNTKTQILFFGNLPPFTRFQNPSFLYLQNCFLIGTVPFPKDSVKEFLRNFVESRILKFFYKNVDEIHVQTKWMKTETEKWLSRANVQLKPFLPDFPKNIESGQLRMVDYLYVGSLSQNKRFQFFLDTFLQFCSSQKVPITAVIVLDESDSSERFKQIVNRLNITTASLAHLELKFLFEAAELKLILAKPKSDLQKHRIVIVSKLSHLDVFQMYSFAKTFVCTSRFESFCLPLYEASNYGCRIIAPKAGYSADLSIPVSLFPIDDRSGLIARLKDHLTL